MNAVPRQPLSRQRILDAALQVGDEHGLEAISMRRVAKQLGVEAMSLYNHVPNKAAMVAGMLEHVFGSITVPPRDAPWPDRLRALGLSMHRELAAHPVAVTLIVTDRAAPRHRAALQPIEEMFAALHDAGLDAARAAVTAEAFTALIFGTVLLRPARQTTSQADRDELEWFRHTVTANDFPHLHNAFGAAGTAAGIGYQLELLITGIQVQAKRLA
ncbi:TetR/AcrR family transcriptional regulator [Fodinicola acaciae]|uniref:TetR/AcrR family transcriptional regulator n=1 Tax=Fodinicola acaciae TaxID=2681555 RepID=UPI0013D4B1C1|nr:TetR/AcrR family transcriptional regulator [Fodinicola acaciae]